MEFIADELGTLPEESEECEALIKEIKRNRYNRKKRNVLCKKAIELKSKKAFILWVNAYDKSEVKRIKMILEQSLEHHILPLKFNKLPLEDQFDLYFRFEPKFRVYDYIHDKSLQEAFKIYKKMRREKEELETHLMYMPEGVGYYEAKKDFETLAKK